MIREAQNDINQSMREYSTSLSIMSKNTRAYTENDIYNRSINADFSPFGTNKITPAALNMIENNKQSIYNTSFTTTKKTFKIEDSTPLSLNKKHLTNEAFLSDKRSTPHITQVEVSKLCQL